MRFTNDYGLNFQNYWENWFGNKHEGSIPFTRFILKCNVRIKTRTNDSNFVSEFAFHFLKICVAVFRNRSRAAHWSPLVHCTMKMATIPLVGLTDKSVP